MANVDLSSLKFPGLSDTYIIPKGSAFVAYGMATSAEIETARGVGETPVFCFIPQGLGQPGIMGLLTERVSSTSHRFTGVDVYGKTHVAYCNNGTWTNETITPATPSDSNPYALGTAAAGISTSFSRADHVHAMPSAADVGAVASNQGSGNAGKFLVVGNDGVVAPVTMTAWQGGSY